MCVCGVLFYRFVNPPGGRVVHGQHLEKCPSAQSLLNVQSLSREPSIQHPQAFARQNYAVIYCSHFRCRAQLAPVERTKPSGRRRCISPRIAPAQSSMRLMLPICVRVFAFATCDRREHVCVLVCVYVCRCCRCCRRSAGAMAPNVRWWPLLHCRMCDCTESQRSLCLYPPRSHRCV